MDKKISFIIPVYKKSPDKVESCVNKLLDQSYKNLEVICVLDGPDKDVEKCLGKIKNKKLFIKQIEHGGACKARNVGFGLSSGEIVCFWDADCYAEPEMTKVWMMFFDKYSDCDFVYQGYKWADPTIPPYDSEPIFDKWLLTQYNFLSSMNPLKREHVVEWDESLDGLQDWDFWRRVLKKEGLKGYFNRGYGFATDLPDRDSISGKGRDAVKSRIEAVRKKNGDADSDLLVIGFANKPQAIRVAKSIGGNYFSNPSYYVTKDYKAAISIGFNYEEAEMVSTVFRDLNKDCKRIVYWTGMDAEAIQYAPYIHLIKLIGILKGHVHHHLCPDSRAKGVLESIGIKADIVPLPRDEGELFDTLPSDFKVLVYTDQNYESLMDSVIKAMPHINFDKVVPDRSFNLTNYSLIIHLSGENRLNDGSRNALIQGRYMISNIEAPYTGYIDLAGDVTKFKNTLIDRINKISEVKELNLKAREFYLQETSRERFNDRIMELVNSPKMEIV